MTARNTLLVLFAAVFFANPAKTAGMPLTSLESGMSDLVYDLSRSIVTVESYRRYSAQGGSAGNTETLESFVSTGLVCDSFGNILALAPDVVGYERVLVEFEGRSYPAKVVAVDYFTDLALIRTGQPLGDPVRFSEQQVCAGQMIVALGNAYGLRASPAIGFCAGLRPDGALQFSVPVASSSLGGGVFDLSGHLLGIITGSMGQDSRVTLAVPAYQVPAIVSYLQTHGDRQAGYIGVNTTDIEITPPIEVSSPFTFASTGPGNHEVIEQGILVNSIVPGSPAESAGLQKGDLIFAVDSRRIESAMELSSKVRQARPGTVFQLSFLRHSGIQTARVEVGSRGYYHLQPLVGGTTGTDDTAAKVDSLTQLLDYLKTEVGRLEDRVKRLK